MIFKIFNIIGKKNNQTWVSDADRDIASLGPTDSARNSVNLVSALGFGFLGMHRRPMIDSIYPKSGCVVDC